MYPASFFASGYGTTSASAEAQKAVPWLSAHVGEYWADDAGYVFDVVSYKSLALVLTPSGQYVRKLYTLGDGKAGGIVTTLQTKGSKLDYDSTHARVVAARAQQASVSPAIVSDTSSFPIPAAPALPEATGGKGKKGRRRPAAMAPIYARSWFPFAVAGGAIALFGLIYIATRKK